MLNCFKLNTKMCAEQVKHMDVHFDKYFIQI